MSGFALFHMALKQHFMRVGESVISTRSACNQKTFLNIIQLMFLSKDSQRCKLLFLGDFSMSVWDWRKNFVWHVKSHGTER